MPIQAGVLSRRPALTGRAPVSVVEATATLPRYPMALAQFADRYVAALVAWVWVRNTGVPETDGSFAAAALLIEPLEAMAGCSTGRAPPSSHRFCPPVAACE